MSLKKFHSVFLFLFLFAFHASAESVSIPLRGVKKPAQDLLDRNGNNIDVGQASSLIERGEDLSLLDPMPGNMWQNGKYSVSDAAQRDYPTSSVGVRFMYPEASSSMLYMAMYMSRVQSNSNAGQFYRLTLSRSVHAALLRAAFLRKIGYYIPSPRFYKDLKLFFKDEEEKAKFLKNAQTEMGTDFDSRQWVTEDDKQKHSITLASAVLEPAMAEYFDLAWGFAPPARDPNQHAKLQRLSRYRTFRALLVSYVLTDIPESINRFSPKAGSVKAGQATLTHPFAESFSAIAAEDARWAMRRILALSEQELREIVNESQVPESFKDLVYAKLIYRIYNLCEVFDMVSLFTYTKPDLKITTADGLVVDGKVMQEYAPGYPIRFNHGDRQSPYNEGDLGRYLKIDGLSSLLSSALSRFNEKLQYATIEQAANSYKQQMLQKVMDHFKKNPYAPFEKQVEAWGGMLGGFNVNASRHVGTGTYYNSTAAVQLVDTMSVSGNIGVFRALDNVELGTAPIIPMGGVNLGFTRSYTHVRPINSISEGSKEDWKNLFVPGYMKNIAEILDNKDPEPLPKDAKKDEKEIPKEKQQYPIDKFLADLREGEVFVITDAITVGAYAQVSSPLDLLLGITPFSFMNSVSLGADANRVILGQTLIARTKDGIQVILRKENNDVLGVQFDVNFFINVLRMRAQTSHLTGTSDIFVIDYDPRWSENLDPSKEAAKKYLQTRDHLKMAMRALFKNHDTELTYGKFKDRKWMKETDVKTRENRFKFLMFRSSGFSEGQLLRITPPAVESRPDLKPEDSTITLYSYRKGELEGRNLLGLGVDLLNGLFSKKGYKFNWSMGDDPNPANTPYGKAFWRIVDSQVDASTTMKPKYPVSAYLQHVWGGWSIKRDDFFKLVDEIEDSLKETNISSYRLIEKEAFMHMKSLDFYRITSQVSLVEKGIYKLRDLLTQPDADGRSVPKGKNFARFFQKLSGGPARANDKDLFDDIMMILGSGNYNYGYATYQQMCKENYEKGESSTQAPGYWYKGSYYECLEPWMQKLIDLGRSFPTDKFAQAQWATKVLWELDRKIPLPMLLRYLGQENYIFFVRVNGFRTGDEDADQEFFSNTIGQPTNSFEYSNGLINYWSGKTRILPVEMDRSQGGVR